MKYEVHILDRLESFRDAEFLVHGDQVYTYDDLRAHISIWSKRINEMGIAKGESIAIIGDYSPTIIFAFLALVMNKNIVVPLSHELENLDTYFKTAEVSGYIDFRRDPSGRYAVIEHTSKHPLLQQLRGNDEAGLVIFSSGTTGESKAAVLKMSSIMNKYLGEKRSSYRTLIFLKLDHIGGINTLFSIMLNGGSLVISDQRTPEAVCTLIETHKVELLPTTPTFLNMLLLSKTYNEYDLSSLKLISYGTEPMPDSTLGSIHTILPEVTLKQTYGLTELGIFSTKSKDSQSKWMKIGGSGVDIKVKDNILWVKSDMSMLGYLNAPSPFDDEGWYNTGDEVQVDGDYLMILGRKEEIINVGGEKVYPAEVESILLEIPFVKEAVVTGKKSPVTGHIVSATVIIDKTDECSNAKKEILEYCRGRLKRYMIPVIINITEKDLVGHRFKKIRSMVN